MDAYFPLNATSYLTIPTPDGSGQCVHPDVLYFPDGWNGYKYWMAFTPYPNGDDDKENPSMVVSDDGLTWIVPPGLTNPIEPAPALPNHNADPDIVVDLNNRMWLYWMYREPGVIQKVYVRSSTNGVDWSDKEELLSGVDQFCGSPAVLWDGAKYVMWHIDATVSPVKMVMRTCSTPNGAWSEPTDCTITNMPIGMEVAHLNVIKYDNRYRCLLMARLLGINAGHVIYAMESIDQLVWTVVTNNVPLIGLAVDSWDNLFIYRAAEVKIPGGASIWYSARRSDSTWHIGYTRESF